MAVFRVTHCGNEVDFNAFTQSDTLDVMEWKDDPRHLENAWQLRYDYESSLVIEICKKFSVKTILEIGSGPGELSNKIQQNMEGEVIYHLIDKTFAEKVFEENKFKGTFFVKDISLDLDTDGLLPSYDLIICNDVLEHLLAPSNVVKKIHGLMHNQSKFMLSVPNWRMGHQFLYRGLWDYDNVIYFMHSHGILMEEVYPAPFGTVPYPKLSSEESMPDELLNSWNFYFICKKKTG